MANDFPSEGTDLKSIKESLLSTVLILSLKYCIILDSGDGKVDFV